MSAADQSSMAIRTKFGPVNLRRKRLEPQRIKLVQKPQVEAVISKGWLKDCEKSGVDYYAAIKQAMLIAVEQVKANDAADQNFGTPQDARQAEQKIQVLVQGQAKIPASAHQKKKSLSAVTLRQELRERDLMIKYSSGTFLPQSLRKRMRTFVIHNGELLVYYGEDIQARQRNHYSLQDAIFVYERRNQVQYPAWEEGYTQRLRVTVKEREKGPVYLYPPPNDPDGSSKMKMWKRAFSLAKVLTSDNDRKALKVCIGRACSGACTKGWEALVSYYRELAHIKKLVKNMAMRLMKVDLSRGFTKMRLCYRKRKHQEKQMEERQMWAARMMSERLGRLGVQNAKSAADVRDTAISAIQRKFRHYRDDKIFDGKYPLNSHSHNKLQQAKLGKVVNFDLKANTCDTALRLTLDDKSRKEYDTSKEAFVTKRSTYSEANIPVNSGHIFVSDNLSCLSFSYNPNERVTMAHSAMTKADWSQFINMDRISSIVLYTDPMPGASLAQPGSVQEQYRDEGVWFTINGPRIGFGKTLENYTKVTNGLQIAEQLMTGQQAPWVTVQGDIASAQIELPQDLHVIESKADNGPAVHHKEAKSVTTFARIHILGYTFTTEPSDQHVYKLKDGTKAMASVPVHFEPARQVPAPAPPAGTKPADDAPKTVMTEPYFALDLLKASTVGVEVYQGKPDGDHQLFLVGSEPLKIDGQVDESGRPVVKMESSHTIPLRSPEILASAKQDGSNSITLSFSAQMMAKPKEVPMSPELTGLGITTALFTSHRGCWYDPVMGLGKFSIEHVPNYAEIKVNGLGLPKIDDAKGKLYKYRVVASVCGFSATTQSLTRPRPEWKEVLGAANGDHWALKFGGSRLCVPLPPGIWCENGLIDGGARKSIEFKIMRYEIPGSRNEIRPVKLSDFKKTANSGKPMHPEIREEAIYFGRLLIGKVPADMEKNMTIYLSTDPKKVTAVDSFTTFAASGPAGSSGEQQGLLNIEFSLRDRDYVRATMNDPTMRKPLCVGDKAMLMVEETLSTTPDKQQKKTRYYKKEEGFADDDMGGRQKKEDVKPKYPGHVQLREPCLSSEYAESGLGDLPMRVPFMPTMIPNFCTDVIPHKYVLPNAEHNFNREHRPGIWYRVVDHLTETWKNPDLKRRSMALGTKNQPKHIVENASHIVKNVPVNILAVYDGFADVEISDSFMEMWSDPNHSSRMFSIPGELISAPRLDPSSPTASTRHILVRVPALFLRGVHVAGINVYDAQYTTTKQMLFSKRPPTYPFQPPLSSPEATKLMENKSTTQGASQARVVAHPRFTVQAGPLPADAGPAACQYEWSLRLRAASEKEMHEFVALMRRVVRMDNHAQSSKMQQYQTQVAENTAFAVQPGNRPTNGGQLDVLLVEARRLRGPWGLIPQTWKESLLENFLPKLMGTTSGDTPKLTPDWQDWSNVNTVVNFRMLQGATVIPFKGRLLQQSDSRSGTSSPSWADLKSKGHLFKTGLIVPEKVQDLLVDFEVMNAKPGCMSTRIGAIQLPVTARQFLTNPAEPFRNLWLPLLSTKDGKALPNERGELHVMTRWLPADKMPIAGSGINSQAVSVRGQFMKELFHKMILKRVREPVYQLEANFYQHYNPNLVRGLEKPELPKDHTKRHTELLEDSLAYLTCLDRRAEEAWENFFKGLPEDLRGARVGELYLKWIDDGNTANKEALKDLIFRGIPTPQREQIWLDITFASRVMERDGLGQAGQRRGAGQDWKGQSEREYREHADDGMRESSDTMKQLQEDAYNLAAWDSTTPKIPELYDMHLKRVKRAQRVVAALLNVKGVGIVYCESLLVLAFFLLLPQGRKDEKLADDAKDLHRMSESSAFWILYTLIVPRVNGTYKEYYSNAAPLDSNGEPGLRPPQQPGQPDALCAYSGAMLDVMLLDCCLAYYVPQLWNKFQQLGFEISTVFYGAFMRLFATYMPTSSVFRFWDLVFFRSTDPTESFARQPLINLAFGLLRSRQKELLSCNSAFEVRTLILGALSTMYDMSTVIDLTLVAGDYLWGTGGFSQSKVAYMWVQRDKMFRMVNSTTMGQNEALKLVTQTKPLGSLPTVKYNKDPSIPGVSTVELLKYVIPVMQTHIDRKKQAMPNQPPRVHWGMHRSQPLAMRLLSENSFDQAQVHFTSVTHQRTSYQKDLPIPRMVSPYPGSASEQLMLEPNGITFGDIQDAIQQQIPSWGQGQVQREQQGTMSVPEMVFKFFNNRQDKIPGQSRGDGSDPAGFMGVLQRLMNTATGQTHPLYESNLPGGPKEVVSLNDFLTAAVCCSRGTLVEKASALFQLYSYKDHRQAKGLQHRTPVSRLAKSVTEGAGTNEALGRTAAPPDEESDEFRNPALKFYVKSNYPVQNCHLGEVIIPTLGPYTDYSGASPEGQMFNIWGPTPDHHRQGGRSQSAINKVCIGEMKMAIAWMPGQEDSKGQLMVRLSYIKFYSMYVTDYTRMNPWVEVHRGPWNKGGQPVKRWDPRELWTSENKARSWFTTDGPYGGEMKFDATMKDSLYGHNETLRHHIRSNAKDMGWNKENEQWVWNDLWGTQKSILEMKLDPECVKNQPAKVIDIFGIRMVVQSILQRTLVNLTNRQMYMIADSVFNRQANVPAILKAVLVKYNSEAMFKTMAEVEKHYGSVGLVDVTKELVLEQERQIALNGGPLVMFDRAVNRDSTYNLSDWLKSVPFTFSSKRLYVRFAQGGDGERMVDYVDFDSSGNLKTEQKEQNRANDLRLEPVESAMIPLQSRLTKEEFISCLMSSPLLSESLRRLSVIEPLRTGKKTPIQLDVTIMDPHNEEENQQVMDSFSVQQSVLFEVWDMDALGTGKDFLGEAWLPPLQSFRDRMKDMVLPLQAAQEDSDNGWSRAFDSKQIQKGAAITGELYVSVKWDFPARKPEEPKPGLTEEEDRKQRAKYQQELNTGRLTIVIDKAKNLRKADWKGKSSDPQVQVWLRNDAKTKEDSNPQSGWRVKPLFKTKTIHNNVNPDWKKFMPSEHGSKTPGFDVMKGPFEMRFPPAPEGFFQEATSLFKTKYTKQKENEERITATLEKQFGESGLKLRFGAPFSDNRPGGSEGENHKVEVYLGDSIRDFKERLTEACEMESQSLKARGHQVSTPYDNIKIGYRHLVMVFIPTAKLQRLYQQNLHKGQAYTDAYHQALKDPSSWQPLDPARTFSQYPQFGFGRGPTILRVIEGTERYKLSNARFKEWSKEMDKDAFIDTNSVEDGCYGWYKYRHQRDDTNSTEWRPAIFKKSGDNYTVDLAFDKPVQRDGNQFHLTPAQLKDTNYVMLAPRLVSIAPGPHEMHADILLQARSLRQSGKSDWEIENILQKLLDESVEKEKEKPEWSESKMPPKITVDIIQQYLRQEDEKLAAKSSAKP